MKKDSEVRMISDMQHLFSMQIPLIPLKKGERIIASSTIKSWPLITHPHPFYFIFDRIALHGKPRGQIVFQTHVPCILHFFPLLSFCGTRLLWNIHWETFFTHRSLVPDSHNSVKIHYMTHFSPRNLFKNIFLMM